MGFAQVWCTHIECWRRMQRLKVIVVVLTATRGKLVLIVGVMRHVCAGLGHFLHWG